MLGLESTKLFFKMDVKHKTSTSNRLTLRAASEGTTSGAGVAAGEKGQRWPLPTHPWPGSLQLGGLGAGRFGRGVASSFPPWLQACPAALLNDFPLHGEGKAGTPSYPSPWSQTESGPCTASKLNFHGNLQPMSTEIPQHIMSSWAFNHHLIVVMRQNLSEVL